MKMVLDFRGIKTSTMDFYYDVIENGGFIDEIKDKNTRKVIEESIEHIRALRDYMESNNLFD